MKKLYFFILYITSITACSTYESTFQNPVLVIDGSSSDWTTTLDSKNNNISYGISNNDTNLYIRLIIKSQDIQRKIFIAGLTVWIDTTGKKKEILGITCPIKKTTPKMDRNSMSRMQNSPKFKNNQIWEVEFIGFKESYESYFVSNNPYDVEFSIDQDDFKLMYYEMKIPFASIYKHFNNLNSKSLSLGFETGSIDLPGAGNIHGSMGGPEHGGMGRGMDGGMAVGKPGGINDKRPDGMPGQTSMTDLATPTKFWIKNIRFAN